MLRPTTGSRPLVPTRASAVARSSSTCRPHPAHRTAHGWLGRAEPLLGGPSHFELSQRALAYVGPEGFEDRSVDSLRQLDGSVGLLSTQQPSRCCAAAAAVAVGAVAAQWRRRSGGADDAVPPAVAPSHGVGVGGGDSGAPPVSPPKRGTRGKVS